MRTDKTIQPMLSGTQPILSTEAKWELIQESEEQILKTSMNLEKVQQMEKSINPPSLQGFFLF